MANKKRKSAAQKQRAKARQQRPATGGAPPSTGSKVPPRAKRPPQRRPAPWPRRSPGRLSWAAVGAVVVAVGLMLILFATRSGQKESKASAAAIAKVTSVPAATLEKIGVPGDITPPVRLPSGTPPVEGDGKPMVLYIGAEYCPYCAGERWPMVVALSRFGTFSDLGTTTSAADDVFPNTPTLSFYGSSYTSDYLTFSSAETETSQPASGGGYTRLQDLTSEQQQLFSTYNTEQITGSSGAIPFVMIGNLYTWAGTTVDPGFLKGKSFAEIANALADPSSAIGKAIDGSANHITAMICQLTGNQPSEVCSAPYIQQEQAKLQGL